MSTPKRCALYRHFDIRDALLYLGISDDPIARGKQHARDSDWVQYAVRAEITWHNSRAEALAAEAAAIIAEQPIFNEQHNYYPGVAERRAAYIAAGRDPRMSPAELVVEFSKTKDGCRYCTDIDDRCMAHDPIAIEVAGPRKVIASYACRNFHRWTRQYSVHYY